MSLFKKKRSEDSIKLPELPKLEFPSYEPQIRPINDRPEIHELRDIIKETKEQSEIPVRKMVPHGLERAMPMRHMELMGKEEKPLFVRIDNYKQAVNDIEHIKNRLREAEHILDEVDRIRLEENRELEQWRSEINRIKEKLLDIDKKLFEA
ncbi:MAG: hypothetical protein KJ623_00835 [Nanoarchaeota archaeon]|nr:hypothetical protein [Nanoarchaeota archaeon]MBU0963056.1 hypothetical protein [Nanoarchaeota archaeon]